MSWQDNTIKSVRKPEGYDGSDLLLFMLVHQMVLSQEQVEFSPESR